uniref:Uncharacterized protein n=1 Tax=Brassica oleracea TaxID=3712 RepID=A0A3P6DDF5_BRAOL|nr:unnamed protein product [Brassica oleracea]
MKGCLRTPFEDQAKRSSIERVEQEIEPPLAGSIQSQWRELRGRDEGRLVNLTHRTVEMDNLLDPTRRTGELDGAFGPTCPFSEFDDGCFAAELMVGSGLFTLLKVECNKIKAAPCEGCLRTLVEGIKPFILRPRVEILPTCFPREDYELSSRNLTLWCLILCLEMLETSVLGLGQNLGLITALGGVMTTSTYVSRIVFDLIPSRLKVRDMFSTYMTYFSWCCKSLDANSLIGDRGIRTEGSHRFFHAKKYNQGRCRSRIRPWYFRVNMKGQRALLKIDRLSLPGLSVLRWPIVIENDSPLLGFSYTMNVSYNVTYSLMKLDSFLSEENEINHPKSDLTALYLLYEKYFFVKPVISVVSAGFTRNVSALILIFGESCLGLLMECYRSLFRHDLVAFERILMIYLFLERIGQPAVHLANDREESVPFNVLAATFILDFSLSQMFSMLFRDSLGSTETERNALMLEDFS